MSVDSISDTDDEMGSIEAQSIEEKLSLLDEISEEQFRDGRDRRFGATNPEKLDVCFWNVMVKGKYQAYTARVKYLGNLSDNEVEGGEEFTVTRDPIWCNKRVGKTETKLPDGNLVQTGGEHEDFYDPDFLVYNDVIVFHPSADGTIDQKSGNFEIFGYPREVFPPTDFHTATLVPSLNAIVIVGNMSFSEEDKCLAEIGITPVYILKVGSWDIEKKETTGDGPGLTWHHEAALESDDVIRLSRKASGTTKFSYGVTTRKIFTDDGSINEEVGAGTVWKLNVGTWTWTREETE